MKAAAMSARSKFASADVLACARAPCSMSPTHRSGRSSVSPGDEESAAPAFYGTAPAPLATSIVSTSSAVAPLVPSLTGGDHSLANLALMCRSHNGYLADLDYGREAMARHRRSGNLPSERTPPDGRVP